MHQHQDEYTLSICWFRLLQVMAATCEPQEAEMVLREVAVECPGYPFREWMALVQPTALDLHMQFGTHPWQDVVPIPKWDTLLLGHQVARNQQHLRRKLLACADN